MKHFFLFLYCLLTIPALAAEHLTVASTSMPHGEILEFVKPLLAKQGVQLKIMIFPDYTRMNGLVQEGILDANFFQHKPYMEEFNKTRGASLVAISEVHHELLGAYSEKISSVKDLPMNAMVVIPDDPTNGARALQLLHREGLIELENPENPLVGLSNLRKNPMGLKFSELNASAIPRVAEQVDLAFITTNYALEAGVPARGCKLLFRERPGAYVNVVVTRADNKDKPAIRKLAAVMQTDAVRKFIQEKYKDAIVPAF